MEVLPNKTFTPVAKGAGTGESGGTPPALCGRRRFAAAGFRLAPGMLAAGVALGTAGPARAESFPSKPVRIIVPQSAGGVVDVLARSIAQELTKLWGQTVIVDNRPGANTIIGSDLAAKAPADGYTLLLANSASVAINQFLYKKLPYDPDRDFTPIFGLASSAYIVVTSTSLPVNTLHDFIELAKKKPGEITYGSFGLGSSSHIETEVLMASTGIRMTHAPYKGIAEVLPALVRGEIQMALSGIPPAIPLIQGKRIKVLASTTAKRDPALPDVPTAAEAGYPGLMLAGWFGVVAPAGTPTPIVNKIAADLAKIYERKDMREGTLTRVGLEPLLQSPAEFQKFIKEEEQRYSSVIQKLDVHLD